MKTFLFVLLIALTGVPSSFTAPPTGAIFIPRNGAYEGRAGQSHVSFDTTGGGTMSLVEGEWPLLTNITRVAMVFKVQPAGSLPPVEVNQEFDRSPEFILIEEGNQRAGARVLFKLFDKAHRYYGHGMTETWLYPNGEIFITAAARFEGMTSQAATNSIAEAAIRISHNADLQAMIPDKGPFSGALPLNDASIPSRTILLSDSQKTSPAVYWMTGKAEYHNITYRTEGGAPTYYRWPIYLPQAFWGGSLRDVRAFPDALELRWLDGTPANKPNPSFTAVFRMTARSSPDQAAKWVAAERPPLKLDVQGGLSHGTQNGYNDMEGAYEIRKTNQTLKVLLPADTMERTVRLKIIGLTGHGAVVAHLNGKSIMPHLTSEGGIADDPLAPIREQPEGPADMAFFTVPLGSGPQILEVTEAPGVQFAYQTRDRWRSVTCYTTRGGGRYPGFRFSLVDGRLRNMRAYGQRDWGLTENLLTWFPFCGFTPEQMIDQLTDFEIIKNGPDESEFRYVSRNANQKVESEFRVVVPANSPAMQVNITATFTVLDSWPYTGCQFFDVFPFRGVWPEDWWYDSALWLAPDGRWKVMNTKKRTYEGDKELRQMTGGGFFAFYSAERGNMLMLTKNFSPLLPVDYVICDNYIDFHMTAEFLGPDGKPHVPEKGFKASMQYELALWGDHKTTRKQLIEIGKKSIKAGHLVLPGK